MDINTYRIDVGQRINQIRKKLELTLSEFGNQIEHKVNASVVQKWERGISIPNDERVIEISQLGNVSVSWLLYGFDYKNLQNHKLPDSFRTLELLERVLSKTQYTDVELKHIDRDMSKNLSGLIKNHRNIGSLCLNEIEENVDLNKIYELQKFLKSSLCEINKLCSVLKSN